MQGTYPVISISFANVKERDYATTRRKICQILTELYIDHSFLLDSDALREGDKEFFQRVSVDTVREALRQIEEKNYQANLIAKGVPEENICKYGFAFCGKKVLIGS